jgi:hypothetical protein
MSGSTVSVIALAALLVTGMFLECSARRGHDRGPRESTSRRRRVPTATAGQSLGAAMRTTPGRALVLAAWIWLGVHFLAR